MVLISNFMINGYDAPIFSGMEIYHKASKTMSVKKASLHRDKI